MVITRDKSFYKTLISLAIPISLQNLITFAVGFVDNIMIGSLGGDAISGVYMGNQPQIVLQMFVGGMEGAILVLATQYWGRRDIKSIRKVVSIGIKGSIIVGVIMSVAAIAFPEQIIRVFTPENEGVVQEGAAYLRIVGVSYLFFCISQVFIAAMRSVEVARIGLYVSVLALGLNAGLNYVFIFGKLGFPAMGVQGAALATLISRIVEAAVIVIYVFKVDNRLQLKFKDLLQTDRVLLKDFVKYGIPIIAGNLVWSVNMLGNSAILGRFSREIITATSVTSMLHNLIYVWMNGLSSSVGIITGKTVGAGEYDKMKEYAKTVQVMFVIVGLISGLVTFLLKDPFISLYNVDPVEREYASQFINVISITIIGTCYQAASLFGLVKSGGDISFVFKMDTVAVIFVLTVSFLAAFVFHAPAWVVFACLKCDQILKCIVAVVKINRFNWMKNLTRNFDGEEAVT